MILDMNLTFNNHLQQILSVISHKCHLLSKIRKYIDLYTATILYKSMILPIMEYGDVIYSGVKGKLIHKLQTTQNRILSIYTYSNVHIATDEFYILCKSSKLEFRREVHLNLFMHKQWRL